MLLYYYYYYYIIIIIIIIIIFIITIYRLDLKSDVGSSQNVLIFFCLFQSDTSAITLMLCMRMLYFILNLKRLPFPPPPPPKKKKCSNWSLAVKACSGPLLMSGLSASLLTEIADGQPTRWVQERLTKNYYWKAIYQCISKKWIKVQILKAKQLHTIPIIFQHLLHISLKKPNGLVIK